MWGNNFCFIKSPRYPERAKLFLQQNQQFLLQNCKKIDFECLNLRQNHILACFLTQSILTHSRIARFSWIEELLYIRLETYNFFYPENLDYPDKCGVTKNSHFSKIFNLMCPNSHNSCIRGISF